MDARADRESSNVVEVDLRDHNRGDDQDAGYLLLPTFAVPHCDIVLPAATTGAARALLAHCGPTIDHPYKRRR